MPTGTSNRATPPERGVKTNLRSQPQRPFLLRRGRRVKARRPGRLGVAGPEDRRRVLLAQRPPRQGRRRPGPLRRARGGEAARGARDRARAGHAAARPRRVRQAPGGRAPEHAGLGGGAQAAAAERRGPRARRRRHARRARENVCRFAPNILKKNTRCVRPTLMCHICVCIC